MTPLLLLAAAASLLASGSSLLLLRAIRRQERLAERLMSMQGPDKPDMADRRSSSGLLGLVAGLGGILARSWLLSSNTLGQLEQSLVSAGLCGANGLSLFVGSKLLLLVALPFVAGRLVMVEVALSGTAVSLPQGRSTTVPSMLATLHCVVVV